jgi:TIR domain-containing protein
MSDIFISYSKPDHALALRLSAFLEAEGWTVWWNKSLGAADLYRDEIMKQLAAARAVVTIWTPNSIKSDWVRAEAGRAKADAKLIPVKTPDVAYADIPLPFGEMHTENVESTELIRAAIVAQLAKPAVEPSAWAALTKGLKWELLSWWGIIGGALTLFTAISTTLKLAGWARIVVQHWKEWTHAFWVWMFGSLGIHAPPGVGPPVLSFLLFWSLLTVGQAAQFYRIPLEPVADKYRGRAFRLISWQAILYLILFPVALWAWWRYMPLLFEKSVDVDPVVVQYSTIDFMLQSIAYLSPPVAILIPLARDRLNVAVTIFLMSIFWAIIIFSDVPFLFGDETIVAVIVISLSPLILLSVAPAKAVSRRLIFLAIGLLLLMSLNELSKLVLDLTAPAALVLQPKMLAPR